MIELWILLALISAVFCGAKDILSKKVLNNKTDPYQLIFIEYLVLLVGVLIFGFTRIDFGAIISSFSIFILKCFTLFCFTFFYFKLLETYEISLISPLTNLSPVFLIILSSVFLQENPSVLQILGILLIILSTYVLEVNINHHSHDNPHKKHLEMLKKLNWKTIGMAVLMLFLISITGISDKKIFIAGNNIATNLFWTSVVMIIFLFAQLAFTKKLDLIKTAITKERLFVGIITNISSLFVLSALAIPTANVSLVIPVRRTSTLFASIFGGLMFHEKHLLKKGIATAVMLIGVVLIAL
ncbi:EamA family transporter [Candidatus Woesearchaeota archaeon]|nr:EamA family transporter [Candidatus Woesearchaeota archaeon]